MGEWTGDGSGGSQGSREVRLLAVLLRKLNVQQQRPIHTTLPGASSGPPIQPPSKTPPRHQTLTRERVAHVECVSQQQRARGVQRLACHLLVLHAPDAAVLDRRLKGGAQRRGHLRMGGWAGGRWAWGAGPGRQAD